MRFWITITIIVAIGFFAFKSCANKVLPGDKEKKIQVPNVKKLENTRPIVVEDNPEVLTDDGIQGPKLRRLGGEDYRKRYGLEQASDVYTFRNRKAPRAAVLSQLTGRNSDLVLIVDESSNSLLIRGPVEDVRNMKIAVAKLDLRQDEAFIDAWMIFVRGDKVRDFEASFGYSESGSILTASANLGTEGFGVSLPAGKLRASLNIQASNGILEVVDRPQLRISAGMVSEVSTGEEVPFPVTTFNNGIASTSIQFKRVGLLFSAEPLFLDAGRVRLDVVAENGLLGSTRRIGDVEVPSITRQSVKSAATLGFDDAMVIGGLETVRREKRFGILGTKETNQTGRLYVAIMLRSGYPKARPVIALEESFPLVPPDFLLEDSEYGDAVLPPKNWQFWKSGKVTEKLIKGNPSK